MSLTGYQELIKITEYYPKIFLKHRRNFKTKHEIASRYYYWR
jgi:hypothetical protein